ncbi:MAG: DNA polymerase [Nitrosopumilus sp.]|nr:MAG: DNA polymerase [Nitrosopumilus sp.]
MTFFPKSNKKSLLNIRVRKQNRNLNCVKQPREVIGVDTETDNGDIFLIADSDGNYLDLDDITFEKVAEFLLHHEGRWIFFYNLSYDADCILKLLPQEILKAYKWKKELHFVFGKYVIHYIDKKKLTIRKGNHSVNCYDIMQYYDRKSLVNAYKDSIKKPLDKSYLKIKKSRDVFTTYHYARNKRQIRNYCIYDCKLTKELSEYWISIFYDVFGFYLDNWISAGYLAEKVLINNEIDIPKFNEIQYEIQEIARNSFYGGRFELIQRGYIGECYLYDINSAYPFALTTMCDITNGKWFNSKKINSESTIGFFSIVAEIDDCVKISPFPFRKKNGTICYPRGKFQTFATLDELRTIQDDPKIKCTILDSWQFIPNKNCKKPFKKFIEEQYEKRLKLKQEKNPLEHPIKIILNSIYGKMAQRMNNVIGNLFNPVIAAYITGYTRAELYSFTKKYDLDKQVVAYATDSVACQTKIPNLDNKELGSMKLDNEGQDVIFLSNGFYRFNGTWKKRGIGYDNSRKQEIEHTDTIIDKDGNLCIMVQTTRTTHIKSGILYNKLSDVGKIEPYSKKINLNSDKKRNWFSELKSLNDKLNCDSATIPADIVSDLISKEEIDWFDEERYEPESQL